MPFKFHISCAQSFSISISQCKRFSGDFNDNLRLGFPKNRFFFKPGFGFLRFWSLRFWFRFWYYLVLSKYRIFNILNYIMDIHSLLVSENSCFYLKSKSFRCHFLQPDYVLLFFIHRYIKLFWGHKLEGCLWPKRPSKTLEFV